MTKTESHTEGPRKSRTPTQLDPRLDKGLLAYAAAASAAGVSLLALVQPAEAKIVYTKANSEIAPGKVLGLSLNHGGSSFTFSNYYYNAGNVEVSSLKIAPSGGNGVQSYAAVLRSGDQIGPKQKFQTGSLKMVSHSFGSCKTWCISNTGGQWINITRGYLGLKFYIHGKAHYGWARLNVTVEQQTSRAIYALLTGYAYETIANKPITAGKTKGAEDKLGNTLGQLAQGAAGPAVSRKRETLGK